MPLLLRSESTFKEEISVYFDINSHDGLLETYDVDASLKDRLKCLVIIPIVSRTYCDLLSPEILELDPIWAPLRNQPEFKKKMESN